MFDDTVMIQMPASASGLSNMFPPVIVKLSEVEGPKIGSLAGLRERRDFQLRLSQHDESINYKSKHKYALVCF